LLDYFYIGARSVDPKRLHLSLTVKSPAVRRGQRK
jgi:hypothetical protein